MIAPEGKTRIFILKGLNVYLTVKYIGNETELKYFVYYVYFFMLRIAYGRKMAVKDIYY